MRTEIFIGDNEQDVVEDFRTFLGGFNHFTFAGFNIRGFDLPNIQSRFIKYNVEPIQVFGNKYNSIDVMDLLNYGSLDKKGSLEDYLKFFGMEGKYNGFTGADVQRLYDEKRWEDLKKYSLEDARLEHELLLKVLQYQSTIYNVDSIITFDIETIVPDCNIPSKIDIEADYFKKLKNKYKKQETIDKYMREFDIEGAVLEKKSELAFNKLKNKIIAISVAWGR